MLQKIQIKNIQKSIGYKDERAPVIFNALSDPGRFRIFKLLKEYDDLCVTDIAAVCGISISACSQQLKILEMTGLIRKERRGQTICYKIRNDEQLVKSIIKIIP